MTDQETIAALAAELTRIGKLPEWIGSGPKNTWAIFEDGTTETVLREDAVLAALSGVAAEFISEYDRPKIGFYANAGWYVTDRLDDEEEFDTYHEALIAALRQVEVKA